MSFNIMVVDDSETMRAVVKKVVGMSGVAVGEFYEAENGLVALRILDGLGGCHPIGYQYAGNGRD